MLLAVARTVAEARAHLGSLADRAQSDDASLAYERTLLYLDTIRGNDAPGISSVCPATDADAESRAAERAISRLADAGLDPLQVELLLAFLEEARELDIPA